MDAEHSLNKPRAKPSHRLLQGGRGGGKPRDSGASADAAQPARARKPKVVEPEVVEQTPQVLTAKDQAETSRRVCEAFRARIGPARYAVWFGDAARVVAAGRARVK